jgi:hypothetical protein
MFDKKYIAWWTVEENRYNKWMKVFTSFGQKRFFGINSLHLADA